MPVISGESISGLVDLFNMRGVCFYHACQYKDFKTYVKLGGVPSRQVLEVAGLPFTYFDTDSVDKQNSVWDKVFGNLQDFGISFAYGQHKPNTAPVPNPYGPILLVFSPSVFYEADDIAICLRSAGAENFDRDVEALSTANDVNKIFRFENINEASNDFEKQHLKWEVELQKTFRNLVAKTPEVSCTVSNGIFSFQYLKKIIVDPYSVYDVSLLGAVSAIADKSSNLWCANIYERRYKQGEDRFSIKQELADLLLASEFVPTLPYIRENPNVSNDLKDYAFRLQCGGMSFQYERFAKYLRNGTILEMHKESL